MKGAGRVARMGKAENVEMYRVLLRKSEGKILRRSLGIDLMII
jgi:hypothetical protein